MSQYPDVEMRDSLARKVDLDEGRVQVRLRAVGSLFCFDVFKTTR